MGETAASAVPLTLFNTGVDATGAQLPGGSNDPHYTFVAGSGIPPTFPAVVLSRPAGSYVESASSKWVWMNSSGSGAINSNYTIRETFDLTGLDPATATISGMWAVDNVGNDILINGVSTGQTVPGFSSFKSFTINSGFISGINTLDFVADDQGNPGGLNVTSLTGSASPFGVPEPGTDALFCAGRAALAGAG